MSKIMIVDDDESIRYLIRQMLEKNGHEVLDAASGERCLETLKTEKPDLILMDVMMPDIDGWEAAEEIRKDKANDDIIIAMLTVKSGDEDKIRSLDAASAEWHISKPIKKDRLIQTVDWLLKRPLKR